MSSEAWRTGTKATVPLWAFFCVRNTCRCPRFVPRCPTPYLRQLVRRTEYPKNTICSSGSINWYFFQSTRNLLFPWQTPVYPSLWGCRTDHFIADILSDVKQLQTTWTLSDVSHVSTPIRETMGCNLTLKKISSFLMLCLMVNNCSSGPIEAWASPSTTHFRH